MISNIWKKIQDIYVKSTFIREVTILFIIGLIPLIWFTSSSQLVIGHDSGFPLDPVSWTEARIHTWSDVSNFGSDSSISLGSLFIHAPEYLLSKAGVDIYTTQRVTFIFWSVCIALSMYALLYFITSSDQKYTALRLSASTFYLVNYYVLQAWFIAERTKFSIMIATPLVLLFLFRAFRTKKYTINAIYAALALTIFNGGGSAFTLYGGLILVLICFFFSLKFFFKFNWNIILKTFVTFGIAFLVLNVYWIVPQIYYAKNSYTQAVESFGGIDSTIQWAAEISKDSSIPNLLRLQGFPDWSNPNHPYSTTAQNNNAYQIISWILPILAFLPLIIYRKNKNFRSFTRFLTLTAVVSILFTSGMHAPFGFIYEFMLRYVPFFTTFRTPFYKFGYALWFAYAILIGLTINYFAIQKFLGFHISINHKDGFKSISLPWKAFTIVLCLIAIGLYSFPYFNSTFFKFDQKYTTLVNPPSYIFDYQKWGNQTSGKGYTLLLPPQDEISSADKYEWGYYSLEVLPRILSSKKILSNSFSITPTKEELALMQSIYDSIENNPKNFERISQIYEIDSLLIRSDVEGKSDETISKIINNINEMQSFIKTNQWGEWIVYERASDFKTVEIVEQNSNINLLSNISHYNAKKILENIPAADFAINSDVQGPSYYVLDSSVVENVDQNTNTIKYLVSSEQTKKNNELLYKRNTESSVLLVDLRRNGNQFDVVIRESDINVKIGKVVKNIKGRSKSFSFVYDQSIKYISVGNNIFNVTENIGSNFVNIGKFYADLTKQLDLSFHPNKPTTLSNNAIFDEVAWDQIINRCGGKTNSYSANVLNDGGNKYVEISANDSVGCAIWDVAGIKPSAIINFTVNLQWQKGDPPRVCFLEQRESSADCIIDKTLFNIAQGNLVNYSNIIKLDSTTKKLLIHLYAQAVNRPTVSLYNYIDMQMYESVKITTADFKEFANAKLETIKIDADSRLVEITSEKSALPLNYAVEFENSSFEYNDWGGGNVCGEFRSQKADISVIQSKDKTDGNNSINLQSQTGTACYFKVITNFEGSKMYNVSFDYKNESGLPGEICLLQRKSTDECLPKYKLKSNSEWEKQNIFVQPEVDTKQSILHFYSVSEGQNSSNFYDNLKINYADNPFEFVSIYSYNDDEIQSQNSIESMIDTPSIKSFAVNSNNTITLKLNQKYSQDWTLYSVSDNPNIVAKIFETLRSGISSENKQNLVFNSWTLTRPSGEYLLIYKPQLIYIVSLAVSLPAFILAILYIIMNSLKRNKNSIGNFVSVQRTSLHNSLNGKFENFLVEP